MEMSSVVISPVPPATALITQMKHVKTAPQPVEEDDDSDEDEFKDITPNEDKNDEYDNLIDDHDQYR